jgi:uncharacterized cupin superfamily protein
MHSRIKTILAGLATSFLFAASPSAMAQSMGTPTGFTIPTPGAPMTIYHIYSDAAGESHMGKITWTPIEKPAFGKPDILHQYFEGKAVAAVMIAGAPNYTSPFHSTGGFHELIYVLAGSSMGKTSDGSTQTFHAGDIILLEDVSGKGATFGFGPQGYLGLSVVLSKPAGK